MLEVGYLKITKHGEKVMSINTFVLTTTRWTNRSWKRQKKFKFRSNYCFEGKGGVIIHVQYHEWFLIKTFKLSLTSQVYRYLENGTALHFQHLDFYCTSVFKGGQAVLVFFDISYECLLKSSPTSQTSGNPQNFKLLQKLEHVFINEYYQ